MMLALGISGCAFESCRGYIFIAFSATFRAKIPIREELEHCSGALRNSIEGLTPNCLKYKEVIRELIDTVRMFYLEIYNTR